MHFLALVLDDQTRIRAWPALRRALMVALAVGCFLVPILVLVLEPPEVRAAAVNSSPQNHSTYLPEATSSLCEAGFSSHLSVALSTSLSLRAPSFAIALFICSSVAAWAVLLAALGDSRSTGSRELDWVTGLFVASVSLVVLIGWVGVILASLGIFSLMALSIALLVITVIAIWLRWPVGMPSFGAPGFFDLGLIVLLLGCALVYFRPHEYVLGGTDAGTYVNMGATVARTGALVSEDPWTRLLSEYPSTTLREQPPFFKSRYLQFVGWYIDDANASRLVPQFFPMHPTLIAVGISLAGLRGGLLTTPLWGVLSIAAVYLIGRKLFGGTVGLLAALLLASTPTQVFFSRYPTAEPLTTLLVFAGLLGFQNLWDSPSASPAWGAFGGATIGSAFLTRIDLPLVLVLIAGALVVCGRRDRWSPRWSVFTVTLGVFSTHALISALLVNWPYTWNTYGSILRALLPLPTVIVAVLGSVVILGGFILVRARYSTVGRRVEQAFKSDWFRGFLTVLVVALSVYAYFLRPVVEPIRYYNPWPSTARVPILNHLNWVRLGWYLTPLGLALATLGLAKMIWRGSFARLGFFLAVGAVTTVQYVYKSFIPSYHIYMMRRYVPIVVPMLMLYASVAVQSFLQMQRIWLGRAISLCLVLGLAGGLGYQSRFALVQRDYHGAIDQLRALNEHLEPDSIVVINERAESMFADQLGVPLQFIFDHDVATIWKQGEGVEAFIERMLEYAAESGRSVHLIAIDPIADPLLESLSFEPVGMILIQLQRLEHTFDRYPSRNQKLAYGVEVYNVRKSGHPRTSWLSEPMKIDIGVFDAVFIRAGFHNKEFLPGEPAMRWTSDEALIEVPPCRGSVEIELRAKTYRPEGVVPSVVSVSLDGQVIGKFIPETAWRVFSFRGEASSSYQASSLRFDTETFSPADLQVGDDTRDLGFLVDWVKISPRPYGSP